MSRPSEADENEWKARDVSLEPANSVARVAKLVKKSRVATRASHRQGGRDLEKYLIGTEHYQRDQKTVRRCRRVCSGSGRARGVRCCREDGEVEDQRGEENSEAGRTDAVGSCRLPLT